MRAKLVKHRKMSLGQNTTVVYHDAMTRRPALVATVSQLCACQR